MQSTRHLIPENTVNKRTMGKDLIIVSSDLITVLSSCIIAVLISTIARVFQHCLTGLGRL